MAFILLLLDNTADAEEVRLAAFKGSAIPGVL